MIRLTRLVVWLTAALAATSCGDTGGGQSTAGQSSTARNVPRNRTLIMDCGHIESSSGIQDYDSFNPFLLIGLTRTGTNFLYEPLYFYSAYAEGGKMIPWIAESYEYNGDYTELTVHIRDGVEWSDGTPWTAQDIQFTLNMLKENAPELFLSQDMLTWVEDVEVIDPLTAKVILTAPNPRFMLTYFAAHFDNGVQIVPKHIWEGKDAKSFKNMDLQNKVWPVVSGPYQIAVSEPQRRILDRRDDWWAAKIGFQELPKVERLIYLPYMDEPKRVQSIIANDIDTCYDLRPPNIFSAVNGNPNVTTWTGREPPLGYLDWWPICLGFNDLEVPFSDPEIRRAINFSIDRKQLVDIAWQGAGSVSLLPFPYLPPMMPFLDSIQDLVEKYEVGVFDPARTAEIMQRKGWTRDAEGFWTKDGARLRISINIYEFFKDLTPVLVKQLRDAGFDADFRMTPEVVSRMATGSALAYLIGNGGGVRDPYFTCRLYHSRHVLPTGTHAERYWRWANEEYSAIVDKMGQTAPEDPELMNQFRAAMEIWLRELPSIPLVQWYHRIPHNETYWRGWPNEDNPYVNSAYWAKTWLLVLLELEPTQG